jgi:hypothetical protein
MQFETSHPGIPQELKALRQWVAWWSVAGQGTPVALPNSRPTRPLEPRPKPHKLPINAATGGLAMANNPGTWTTYEQACRAVERFLKTLSCKVIERIVLSPWADRRHEHLGVGGQRLNRPEMQAY